jgi:hypothetical protein
MHYLAFSHCCEEWLRDAHAGSFEKRTRGTLVMVGGQQSGRVGANSLMVVMLSG